MRNFCKHCQHRKWFFGWYCEHNLDMTFKGVCCRDFVRKDEVE